MSAHQAGATTLTQQSENFGYSAVRLRRIAKLQFGIVNPGELVGWLLHHTHFVSCRRVQFLCARVGLILEKCVVVVVYVCVRALWLENNAVCMRVGSMGVAMEKG
jgi:hypothetical protein